MATGSSEQSLTDSIKLTENPLVGASIQRYQLHKLHVSYSRFCVENRKFSLPWQQGSVRAKCDWKFEYKVNVIGLHDSHQPMTIKQQIKM